MKVFITAFSLLLALTSVHAQNNDQTNNQYQAGLHYQIMSPAWTTEQENPVVYEFFSYMCPGCYAFEPHMKQLSEKLTDDQQIVRIPVAFYPQWEPHAKAYHALEMMGELERVHEPLFQAIHQYKVPLRSLDDIATWLADSYGVEKSLFLSTAKSFSVDSKIRKNKQMAQALGISRVPSLVVDGKYKPDFDQLKTPGNIVNATISLLNQ